MLFRFLCKDTYRAYGSPYNYPICRIGDHVGRHGRLRGKGSIRVEHLSVTMLSSFLVAPSHRSLSPELVLSSVRRLLSGPRSRFSGSLRNDGQ